MFLHGEVVLVGPETRNRITNVILTPDPYHSLTSSSPNSRDTLAPSRAHIRELALNKYKDRNLQGDADHE
ncbi:hypothetical protein V1477_015836, partial [Vespula maculifrons]